MPWILYTKSQNLSRNHLQEMLYILSRLREEVLSDVSVIRILCPTCWIVKAETLQNVFKNYEVLMEL